MGARRPPTDTWNAERHSGKGLLFLAFGCAVLVASFFDVRGAAQTVTDGWALQALTANLLTVSAQCPTPMSHADLETWVTSVEGFGDNTAATFTWPPTGPTVVLDVGNPTAHLQSTLQPVPLSPETLAGLCQAVQR